MRRIDFFIYLTIAGLVGFIVGHGARPTPEIVIRTVTIPIETVIRQHECSTQDAVKWWNNSDLSTAKKQLCK